MILNSLVTQIIMAVLAVGIFFTYVQPTFSKIGETQTAIEQYKIEFAKVDTVNNNLRNLYAKANDMPSANKAALTRYMPDVVDNVSVSRDIFLMTKKAGAYLESVESINVPRSTFSSREEATAWREGIDPVPHAFAVSISGTYTQVKDFLKLLEENNYPLEVSELRMGADEKSLMTTDITIITYSRI